MSTTAGNFDFNDWSAAAVTGLPFPVKNLSEFVKIISLGAVGFNVGGHSGAARINRGLHDRFGGLEKTGGIF